MSGIVSHFYHQASQLAREQLAASGAAFQLELESSLGAAQ
jgi:hypothetical protein